MKAIKKEKTSVIICLTASGGLTDIPFAMQEKKQKTIKKQRSKKNHRKESFPYFPTWGMLWRMPVIG